MKILLVDDSKTMRSIQKRVLEGLPGAQFLEAADGIEALKLIAANGGGCDLALIDWNMPNMDGLTLVKRIRETDQKSALIMCTTEAEKSRILDALKAGVNNYVVKPFTPETLLEKVQGTLKKVKEAA
jgi:two-component system chemotaxis response regulator CheY